MFSLLNLNIFHTFSTVSIVEFNELLAEILDIMFCTSLTLTIKKVFLVFIFIWISLSICATKSSTGNCHGQFNFHHARFFIYFFEVLIETNMIQISPSNQFSIFFYYINQNIVSEIPMIYEKNFNFHLHKKYVLPISAIHFALFRIQKH